MVDWFWNQEFTVFPIYLIFNVRPNWNWVWWLNSTCMSRTFLSDNLLIQSFVTTLARWTVMHSFHGVFASCLYSAMCNPHVLCLTSLPDQNYCSYAQLDDCFFFLNPWIYEPSNLPDLQCEALIQSDLVTYQCHVHNELFWVVIY